MVEGQTQLLIAEGFYDLWLATLVIAFSASLILLHTYLKSRKTPIGRAALYTSLSSLIWSITVSLYTFPEVQRVEFTLGFIFLGVGFLAGLITILSAYERAKIQSILTPSGTLDYKSKPLLILSIMIIPIVLLENIIAFATTIPNSIFGVPSILTTVCLIIIALSLVCLNYPESYSKLKNYLAIFVALIGAGILTGYLAINYNSALDSILPGGATTIEAAKGFLFAGLGIILVNKKSLKAWFAKIILSMGMLFVVILDLVAELLYHPAFLPHAAAICFVIIGIVQLSNAFKNG